ncbi:MAG: class I SAM-dependent methyltransferase [Myxococcota bacterium]|jgi:ubiquinone/menaquinone biosynthesis C-methylase UbiE
MAHEHYVPAFGFDWLTRFYDPVLSLTLREREIKGRLLDQAALAPGQDVLDVGCGTGTLAILAKQRQPSARVVGLDGDPRVLAIAQRKTARAGVEVTLREGLAGASHEFADASFDRILTSLVLHHLTTETKRAALAAMCAWLRPAGELHVLDFGPNDNALLKLVSRGIGWIDGETRVRDNWEGRLPSLMREAGFARADELGRAFTPFGSVSFYKATLA